MISSSSNSINDSAIIFEDKSLSHSELSRFINNTAAKYLAKGIKPGDRVAILSENSPAYIISIYALWRINAIPIPLNIRLKEAELRNLIDFSEVEFLLKSESFSTYLADKSSIMLTLELDEYSIEYKNETKENDVAAILFTSGSSGNPKGVEITNSNLYESYLNASSEYTFTWQDRFLASLPFFHIGGFSIITRSLLSGGTLIIPKSLRNDAFAESFQKQDPTIISLVPVMLKRLIEDGIKPNENLRLAFIGGGPSDSSLVEEAIDWGWPFVKVYGSTETCSMVSGIDGEELKNKPSSGGRAFENVDIKIFNEFHEKVETLHIGEIAVSAKSIAKGYLGNKELWNEKNRDGYYLTGDSGYIDEDGCLFVVSRRTDLIISGGENIDPSEIEKILNEYPDISDSIVFPVPDEEWGQIPIAVLEISESEKFSKKNILDYLKKFISSYKLPRKIFFIKKMPRTALGKVDLNTLKEKFNLD